MKKSTIFAALMAGSMTTITLTGCGTTSGSSILSTVGQGLLTNMAGTTTETGTSTATSETAGSLLGNLLGSFLGQSTTISQSNIVGTWNYQGTDCVFESQNLLAQAGGAVASGKIESQLNTQLAKVGIKQGACSFTFNKDNTYSATIGSRTISGNYRLDTKNKQMTMTYLAGLGTMTPHVAMQNGKLSLLFESDKLLTLMKGVSAISGSSSIKTISSLLGNYEGLYIGLQMSK